MSEHYLNLEGLTTYTEKVKEFVEGSVTTSKEYLEQQDANLSSRIDQLDNLNSIDFDGSGLTLTTDIDLENTSSVDIPTEGAVAMVVNDTIDDLKDRYMLYEDFRNIYPKEARVYYIAKDEKDLKLGKIWRIYFKNQKIAERTDDERVNCTFPLKFPFKFG
jgi:hypothetical protein